jgi:hypothetical protein
MKHMVRMQLTPQAGRDIEARPGGPGPVMGRLIERFKPEIVYMSPARRELFAVFGAAVAKAIPGAKKLIEG